jgi:hypothetical protein
VTAEPETASVEEINDAIVVNQIVQAAVTSGQVDEMLSDDFVESSTVGEEQALEVVEIANPIPTETTAPRQRQTDNEGGTTSTSTTAPPADGQKQGGSSSGGESSSGAGFPVPIMIGGA